MPKPPAPRAGGEQIGRSTLPSRLRPLNQHAAIMSACGQRGKQDKRPAVVGSTRQLPCLKWLSHQLLPTFRWDKSRVGYRTVFNASANVDALYPLP